MKEISDYTRVTDVLYPFSGIDKINPEVLKKAQVRGTYIHDAIEELIEGKDITFTYPDYPEYIRSFQNWWEGKNIGPQALRFFCDNHRITGKLDCLYLEDDGYVLVDFKTSSGVSKSWMLQGSAYSYLAKKDGFNIKRIEFVKLDKNGKIPKVYEYKEDFSLFVKCLDVYRYFFKDKTEENPLDYL